MGARHAAVEAKCEDFGTAPAELGLGLAAVPGPEGGSQTMGQGWGPVANGLLAYTSNPPTKKNEQAEAARRHAEYLAITEGGGSSTGYTAPAASSWVSAPAAPVQQNDPCFSAPNKQERPLSPDQQRKAAKAAGTKKAADARKETEKPETARRPMEYLANKECGRSPTEYSDPATPVQQNDHLCSAPDKQARPLSPDQHGKAAKAAETKKAVDARQEIEKAEAARSHAEYWAFRESGGTRKVTGAGEPTWTTEPRTDR